MGRSSSGASADVVHKGELVRTALRLRPDRVVVGELGEREVNDLFMAMNRGLDGVLGTLQASSPRAALDRLGALMSADQPGVLVRGSHARVVEAVDLIVLLERHGDGRRRVTRISEVVGLTGDTFATQDLFTFNHVGEDENGRVLGSFEASGLAPRFMVRVRDRGLERRLREALGLGSHPGAGKGARWQGK